MGLFPRFDHHRLSRYPKGMKPSSVNKKLKTASFAGSVSREDIDAGAALVIDSSKYLTAVTNFDAEACTVSVEPGLVLDALNKHLAPHGVFFPVDVSTSSRATIGGMAGNNSVGARSLRYGHMVDNVLGIDAVLANGERMRFDPLG